MPAKSPKPMSVLVALYHHPKDAGAFERYYEVTHMPIVTRHLRTLGIRETIFMKFTGAVDGSRPQYYRKAELWFDSDEARTKAMGMPGFGEIAGDIPNFATGGVTILLGERTNG